MMSDSLIKLLKEQTGVKIKNPDNVMKKLDSIAKDGINYLQVISDFDKTITKHKHLNKRCSSCHHILETHNILPAEAQKDLKNLKEKYYNIEIDHKMTKEEKIPHMIDWWSTSHNIFVNSGIQKESLAAAVENSLAMLRKGVKDFFDILYKYEVPLLIFSAGVGDILEEIIRQQATLHPNIKTVSNFMKFDGEGNLVGFHNQLIHTFNKNEGALKDSSYFEEVASRCNVILLGDMEADSDMANGVSNLKNCLKVGFLNDKVEERLEKFLDIFDIVLIEDETLTVPDAVLQFILNGGKE